MGDRTLHDHRTIFTHANLKPKNITIERVVSEDESPSFKVTLIDWQISGWYPEFWESCNATIASRFNPA